MQQTVLWHDTLMDAIAAAIQAAGGLKKVAARLWPALDSTSATARLRACLNPDHAQKLCPLEVLMIAHLARDAGDDSIMEFMARELRYEIKPLSPIEAKKRAKRSRRLALLEELRALEEDE